jgi:hypothetical protein
MERLLLGLLLPTRFTTNRVSKTFLPGRAGLGYKLTYARINKDVLRPCLRAKRKTEKTSAPSDGGEEELAGKSCMVKNSRRL